MTQRSALLTASPTNAFFQTGERALPAVLRRRSSLVWLGQTALLAPCTTAGKARSQARYWREQALIAYHQEPERKLRFFFVPTWRIRNKLGSSHLK
ncbi:hypothetical protein C6Q17_24370 [Burkholderia contaminans]|nr:hypothetical protein C6Q17_24370 [Burkholderia contaminans]